MLIHITLSINSRVGVRAVAADRRDVELVVAALLAVERVAHAQTSFILIYHHNLK